MSEDKKYVVSEGAIIVKGTIRAAGQMVSRDESENFDSLIKSKRIITEEAFKELGKASNNTPEKDSALQRDLDQAKKTILELENSDNGKLKKEITALKKEIEKLKKADK